MERKIDLSLEVVEDLKVALAASLPKERVKFFDAVMEDYCLSCGGMYEDCEGQCQQD